MKIPKWHEVEITKINVAWDMGREGERPCVSFFIEINGKIYCTQYYDKNANSVNIGEIVSRLVDSLQRKQDLEEIAISSIDYINKGL